MPRCGKSVEYTIVWLCSAACRTCLAEHGASRPDSASKVGRRSAFDPRLARVHMADTDADVGTDPDTSLRRERPIDNRVHVPQRVLKIKTARQILRRQQG